MKKKHILYGITLAFVLITTAACFWYFTPKAFLKGVEAKDIASISVFHGGTGNQMTLDDENEIHTIVNNIQSVQMHRGKISSHLDGFAFSLAFIDKDGNVIDSFIVNGKAEIRDDPFFYKCKNGELCITYLRELEDKYCVEK